jgi:hypothetical protein
MRRRLAKGDARVFKVLADRAYGKVKEQVEADIYDSLAEKLQAARCRVLEGLSDAEIVERIEQVQRQLQLKAGDTVETPQNRGDASKRK